MTIASHAILDRLPADSPCLGAVFTCFAFDPRVFEEQVLRAVLDLHADPVNQSACFLENARAKLRGTPVVAIVDAGQRQPGRRMPYDLLEVDKDLFHPKVALLLYEDHARVQVGSGNLTRGGLGGNAELSMLLKLKYEDATDALLLRTIDGFLERCAQIVRNEGTQLSLVRQELARRLPSPPEKAAPRFPFALLDGTLDRPLLEQIFDLLPEGATVTRVGLLAPYYEADAPQLEPSSVFGRLLELAGPGAALDVGLAWDNPSPRCERAEIPALEEGLHELWCWRTPEAVEYLVPTRIMRKRFEYIDDGGHTRHWPLDDANRMREAKGFWPVGSVSVFAPRKTLANAASQFRELTTWLFPAICLHEATPRPRPLHAKLIVIAYEQAGAQQTLVIVGSANLSRAALLRGRAGGGNVELCAAFVVEGHHHLREFAGELIHIPRALLHLQERDYPDLGTNFGLCIQRALHDPLAATLEIQWDRERSASVALGVWELQYEGATVLAGDGMPAVDPRVSDFVLRRDCAELILRVGEGTFSIPILVTDLALLPVRAIDYEMSLQSMLLILGGRIGHERAAALEASTRQAKGESAALAEIFGEGFRVDDVFRAWWGVRAQLERSGTSLQGFRGEFVGPLGVRAVWSKIVAAATSEQPSISRTEAWFFGAELLRELERVQLSSDATGRAKATIRDAFLGELRAALGDLFAPDAGRWAAHVLDFYGVDR